MNNKIIILICPYTIFLRVKIKYKNRKMTKKKKWIPIESNPDSLYLYSCKLGQQKLSFVDIYGFNKDLLDMVNFFFFFK